LRKIIPNGYGFSLPSHPPQNAGKAMHVHGAVGMMDLATVRSLVLRTG
jgi:hypothetical protein